MVNHHESSINGPCSIAMLSNQRVPYESGFFTSFNHVLNGDGLEPIVTVWMYGALARPCPFFAMGPICSSTSAGPSLQDGPLTFRMHVYIYIYMCVCVLIYISSQVWNR